MQAMVYSEYGLPDVLRAIELPTPIPREGEVLVKLHAASVNSYDWRMLTASPFLARFAAGGLLRPTPNTILGVDIAGTVTAIGSGVTALQPGDAVYGDVSACGRGGFAEYIRVPAGAVAQKPAGISFEQAAALPMAAVTALQALRDAGRIQAGQQVLINGASGGVGTFAVQLAKWFGAEVTAVCGPSKQVMVRGLGADQVIDYTRQDFTQSDTRYDLILGINGDTSIWAYRRALKPQGSYVMVGGSNRQIFQAALLGGLLSRANGKRLAACSATPNVDDLRTIGALVEAGTITPVIDRRYPLHELPDAMRYLGAGHAAGKIIITIA